MNRKNVEDLYPLSPLQQGMLFHTLYSPGTGAYLEQMGFTLRGNVRPDAFRRAWQAVVDRHPALRSGFVWEGVPQPLQVVYRQAEVPFTFADWRLLSAAERDRRYREEMEASRARGVDMVRAPLLRVRLYQVGDDEHRFVLDIHHILFDGWSLPIILGEFAALYYGIAHGELPRLPARRPFRDYITWLKQQDERAAEAFWRGRLAGVDAPTPLPLDRDPSRAGAPSERHAQETVVLPPSLAAAVDAAARGMRTTASGVWQCAWAAVLAAYSGERDVVFGATVSGRPPELPGVEEMVGMFINTVPVRVRVPRAGTVAEWVQDAHGRQNEARLYEHAPLAQVQAWSQGGRFETLLVYENYPVDALQQGGGAEFEAEADEDDEGFLVTAADSPERTNYPLSLVAAPSAERFRVTATFDPTRIAPASVRTVLGGLARVLEQIADDPQRPMASLAVLDADEARRVVHLAETAIDFPRGGTVHALFEAAAARTPDAVALQHGTDRITYAELNARANRLAHRLRALGVGPEASAGVCLERTPELVVALLAVLKAGGAYIPLDPAYPAERLGWMLGDADARVVIAERRTEDALPATDARVLLVDAAREEIARESAENPPPLALDENLAWTIYTSGSTGRPKGVQIEHRGAAAFLHHLRAWVPEEELRGVLLSTSVSFDVSIAEVFFTLAWGGRLVMVENALSLAELGDDAGVVRASMVPSAAAELARMGRVPSTVRTFALGGEPLAPAIAAAVHALPSVTRVENQYGPTEDTTYSCSWIVPRGTEKVLVGRPVAGSRAYVLDDLLRPVPFGARGELYLAGDGVTRGYRAHPAMTAERYLPDPFGPAGSRMYRTGDLARWVEDGKCESAKVRECESNSSRDETTFAPSHPRTFALEYLGRADFQVKVRGFRIEPGEIEADLLAIPGVDEAVVVARPAETGDMRLAAYVGGSNPPTPAELKERLRASLPDYMVPDTITPLGALPRTPNGKVDRAALPDPQAPEDTAADEAPSGLAEEALAEIWKEVLKRERVGANDSFFTLGGHSLLATQVVSRVRAAFGVELPLRKMFENPTLRALAVVIEDLLVADVEGADDASAGETLAPAAAPPLAAVAGDIVPVPRGGLLPASLPQERLWFIDRMDPGTAGYVVSSSMRLRGAIDLDALRRAVAELVRRHEVLRTTFAEVDGRPTQRIRPFTAFPLPLEDLSADGPEAALAEVERRVTEETGTGFDLAAGPLFRARLFRIARGDHALVLAMHHAVADGWSLGVLYRELAALYSAFSRGLPSPLRDLPVQYADFAAWQRSAASAEAAERQVAWWRAHLDGAPHVLELPTDHSRPPVRTFAGGSVGITIDVGAVARLREVANAEGVTPFMVLLAVFQLLLTRLAGTDDVLVGSPVAGRTHARTEGLIGLFVNTLVLRGTVRPGEPFRDFLARVREDVLDAFAHQDVPFERLVDEVRVERSLARTPLYQAMFSLQNAAADGAGEMEGLRVEHLAGTVASAKTDLELNMHESGDGMYASLVYSADLFRPETAARFARAFTSLVAAALEDPSRAVDALPLMPAAQMEEMAALGIGMETEIPSAPIHRLFEAHAAATPDAPALLTDEARLTYAEVNARANRIARRLRELGVGVEHRVGVSMERSPDLVVALLAVLKAGAAYVPLDPVYPAERRALMRRNAGVTVVVTREGAGDRGDGVRVLSLAAERERIAALGDGDLADVEVAPENLAYVLYTSGSTGTPKGVAVPHRAVVRLVRGQSYARFAADEVFLQFVPVAFDVSTFEVWGALLSGAALAVHPPHLPEPAELGAFAARHGVTQMWLTSGLFHQVVDAGAPGLGGVRRLLSGGDVVSAAHVRRAMELLPDTEIVDGYGPTETTTFATTHVVTREDADAGDIPIGRPLANTRAYVLDERLRPVPPGIPGELYLGGPGVARGYLGAPALTAERFVPDPFVPGERLYRTGDRVRWTECESAKVRECESGSSRDETTFAPSHPRTLALQFLGRADRQVKVRGFRIEPAEVEAALAAHPAVRAAAADTRGEGADRRLVAWVVAADGAEVSTPALREHLSRTLPEHMVPSVVVPIDAIPLTPNGKVDRAALPAPAAVGSGPTRPLTATEEMIATVWAELLGASRVGPDDAFFELGGHSLLAAQVAGRIRAAFGVELPLRALFESPQLSELAARVDGLVRAGTGADDPVVPVPRDGDLPVSFAQERMWFLQQLDPASALYNLATPMRLRGPLDLAALERAFTEIVRRHEPLRTVFALVEGKPVQRVMAPAPVAIPVTDVSRHPDPEKEARRLANVEAATPFDLERGPLYRVSLVRLAADDHVLLLDVHHAVTDGWSHGLLTREMVALYEAFREGRPSPLPELAVQYADYTVWQRRWLTDERVRQQVEYWTAQLAGAPPALELPTDHPRAAVQRHRGGSHAGAFPPDLLRDVHALAARHGATVAMTVLAAFQLVLGRLAGQDDVVVGTPIAGRTRMETEPMVGLFLNTLAIRTRWHGGETFAGLLQRVRETMLGAYAHQDVPFERLLEDLKPERTLSRTPVFQVMFNMLNLEGSFGHAREAVEPGRGELAIRNWADELEVGSKFDLTLYVQETPAGLAFTAAYDADLFERERIAEMMRQLGAVLRQAAADPALRLDAISLRTDAAAPVLPDPATPLPARWSSAVHETFAARAAASPEAAAIVDAAATWTYGEVDAASNRVARRLMEMGIGKGDVVAVHAHRNAWLPVAMLGIAKAGAAWTILDPAYPAARLAERFAAAAPGAVIAISAAGALPDELRRAAEHLPTLVLGETEDLASISAEPMGIEVGADDLAYLVFTSGTTGTPKAVAGTHGPLSHFFRWYADEFGPRAGDRISMLSGLAHDPLLRDVFAPLAAGAALCIPDPARIAEPGWLATWFAETGITIAHLTPAMGQLLATGDARLPALRLAAFGGDVLHGHDVDRLRALAPGVEIVNFYGATETPQAVAYHRVPREMDGAGRVPVGRGIDGVQLLVMRGDTLAGVGEPGEIAVRTPYLAAGYANDAALTAERFRANPLTGDEADRVYLTGDLGRYRPDGAVEIAGRADRQVQVRGFRVEPGEVEAALAAHPAVREAAVVAREAADGGRRLVAYVATHAQAGDVADELRAHLRGRLPEFMVPAAFVRVDALPLTANGKLDLRALPDPDEAAERTEFVAPRTAAEQVLAEIWGEVLNAERVGADDNFFALGGHSLLATQVLSRVEQAFGVKLPVRAIFEHPTVAALAAQIEALGVGVLADADAELAELSDEELAALLAEVGGAEGD
ncbi:MAG TPA: amino acid adenylation domain-containing protein [Longimicrobium sp.]